MTYEIEVYKGQSIVYDDEYDKFICDISVEDKYKTTKRQSLKDVKKEIDAFIKLNENFKPFKALSKRYDGLAVKNFTQKRVDGKYIVKDNSRSKGFDIVDLDNPPKWSNDAYYEFDQDVFDTVNKLEKELKQVKESIQKKIEDQFLKLKPLNKNANN